MRKLLGIFALTAGLWLAQAQPSHAAAPPLLPFQGFLTDSAGKVVDTNGSTVSITFTLYTAAIGGSSLFSETQSVRVDGGFFNVYIGSANTLVSSLFDGVQTLYLGVKVGSDSELTPRTLIASVPYAFYANVCGDSATVDGMASSAFAPVSHTTPWSTITNVPPGLSDGDNDTTYTAASSGGLTLSGTAFSIDPTETQKRLTASCGAGSSIRVVNQDGTVVCQTDTNTTYSAGNGLSLSGNTFSTDASATQTRVGNSCGAGSSIRVINQDGTVVCQTDNNNSYGAGAGLALTGSTFSLASSAAGAGLSYSSGVVSLAPAVAGAGLSYASGVLSVASSTAGAGLSYSSGVVSLASSSAGAGLSYSGGVLNLAPDSGTCASGQLLKSNGSGGWTCQNDIDTNNTYTAAASGGLALSGTAFSLAPTVAGPGLNLSSGVLSVAASAAGSGLSMSGGVLAVAPDSGSCTTGQVLKFTSGTPSTWTCQSDIDTNNVYAAGSGLALTSGTFSIPSGAVTNAMLASGAVTTNNIAAGAVGTTNLAAGAVTSTNLATGAVTSGSIAAGAVGSTELSAGAVGLRELSLPSGTDTVAVASLASGASDLVSTSSFRALASGNCMVNVSFSVTTSGNPTDFATVSAVRSVSGTLTNGSTTSVALPIDGRSVTSTANTSQVFSVAQDAVVSFGCHVIAAGAPSTLAGGSGQCNVSWLCF